MFKLWKNPYGPFPSVRKWYVCTISAVVGCSKCLRTACAVQLGRGARNYSPAIAACACSASWPSISCKLPKFHTHKGCYRNLPSSAYQPWPIWKAGELELPMSSCSQLSPLPRSRTAGEPFGYQSGALPAALCPADTAVCKEFSFQGMPVPMYLKITTSQQEWMQSALLNAWVHSYNCIIQCCELPLLRQCVLDIDCTEGQLVLEKQTGCFA